MGAVNKLLMLAGKGIDAWHGSPHDFDRFSLDKIGTGEGAQAYGHGLYFADSQDVAKQYRDELSTGIDYRGQPLYRDGKIVGSTGDSDLDDMLIAEMGDIDAALADSRRWLAEMEAKGSANGVRHAQEEVQKLENAREHIQKRTGGKLYNVHIDAEPEQLLDWDLPLNEQPEGVRQQLSAMLDDPDIITGPVLRDRIEAGEMTGQDLVRYLAGKNGDQEASLALGRAGVPGLRFKDGFSRGKQGGTHNYVMFDDKLVSIANKYGWGGAGLLGLMNAAPQNATAADLVQSTGYTPEPSLLAALDAQTVPEQPSLTGSVGNTLLELAAAANRGVASGVDFVTVDQANALLQLLGSERQLPTLTDTLSPATTGNHLQPGTHRDVTRFLGELASPI